MLKAAYLTLILAVAGVAVFGCSGGGSDTTATPIIPGTTEAAVDSTSARVLWGMWNIQFDPSDLTAKVAPIRNYQAHYNITSMIIPPACEFCLEILPNSFDPVTRIMDVDVTLRNPFPIAGYDIRGIMFSNDVGHELTNADEWTDLWDIAGGLTINPFKAFAKGEPSRKFNTLAEHTQKYLAQIPKPPQWGAIAYAADASWPDNCLEPYEITNYSQDIIEDYDGAFGSIYIDVYDWQSDVNEVVISVPAVTEEQFTSLIYESGVTWTGVIPNNTDAIPGVYPASIYAKSEGSGELALYDYVTVEIYPTGWVRVFGGTGDEEGYGIGISDSGDVYLSRYFQNTVDFDPGPGVEEHSSNGDYDIYLTKFDSLGAFQWAVTWGGALADNSLGVDVDSLGNVYVIGSFRDTVDFDPGPDIEERTSQGGMDAFLSKFDQDGNFVWVAAWGGISDAERGEGIDIDNTGAIYVNGFFSDTTDFDPGPAIDNHTASGSVDVFVSKYTSDGEFEWVNTFGGTEADKGIGVASYNSTEITITGYFTGTVDFDPTTGVDNKTSNGTRDAFIAKYTSDGDYLWALTWGGLGEDWGFGVDYDGSGSIYVSGFFPDTVDFDPGTGMEEHTSDGLNDIFLSKFDVSGVFQWVRTWGGDGNDQGLPLTVTDDGTSYVTGWVVGTVDFDPGTGETIYESGGGADAFIAKFDAAGDFQWAHGWGGPGSDSGFGVVVDQFENAFIAGRFSETVDFDPSPDTKEHTSKGGEDVFLCKYPPDGDW